MKRSRAQQAGFSVVEALVAAGILGIALVGIVQLHATSIRGTAKAERIGRASETARQIAELFATTSADDLPNCDPGPLLPPPNDMVGCKNGDGVTTVFTDPTVRPNGCVLWVQGGPSTPRINDVNAADGAIVSLPNPSGAEQPSQFRIDLAVSSHPDPATYPDAVMLTVWACWRDEVGVVREVQTRRILY